MTLRADADEEGCKFRSSRDYLEGKIWYRRYRKREGVTAQRKSRNMQAAGKKGCLKPISRRQSQRGRASGDRRVELVKR